MKHISNFFMQMGIIANLLNSEHMRDLDVKTKLAADFKLMFLKDILSRKLPQRKQSEIKR